MAKFVFQMESMLRLKSRIEDQKKQEFAKALQRVEEEKAVLEKFFRDKSDAINKLKGDINIRISPIDFGLTNRYIEFTKEKIVIQKGVIIKVEQLLEQARLELVEATKERKMLDKLKEKKFEEYIDEEKKQEQKMVDEIVSYKYSKA